MPDSFQSTRHREAKYFRPDQGWICGGDCHDCPCYLGPDRVGRCQAGKELDGRRSGQCLPSKAGDRWLCTRQDTHGVPPCEQGPLPDGSCCQRVPRCQPRRSLRKQRGYFTFAASIVTVAALILTFSRGSDREEEPPSSLSAGPLSPNHSFIENKCSACHREQELTLNRLTELHASATLHRAIENGMLCLDCHDKIGGKNGRFAFAPHTTEPFQRWWEGKGKSSHFMMAAASALTGPNLQRGNVHCATCHQEHHGAKLDITAMSNRQCQVCHQNQFASFSNGHPEFREITYPYRRRTAIRFDHHSHYQTHFENELEEHPDRVPRGYDPANKHEESISCVACHDPDPSREVMIVKPFEASCAACHEESTRGGNPIPFFAFPTLNTALLDQKLAAADSPRSIGTWIEEPPDSMPWPTLQLLPADAREAWKTLRAANVNPFDPALEDLDEGSIASVERLAWAVKELARDLSQSSPHDNPSKRVGHDELIRRFEESGFHDAQLLIAGLPSGLVDAMRRGFSQKGYVRLLDEVDAYRKGSLPKPVASPPEEPRAPDPPPPDQPESFGEDTGESFGDGPGNDTGDTGESFGDQSAAPPGGGPNDEASEQGTEENFGEGTEENFGEEGARLGEDADEVFGLPEEPEEGEPTEETEELPAIDPTIWATRGGWYQQYGVVSYRSTGHADPLLKHWIDELVRRVGDPLVRAHLAEGFDFRRGTAGGSSGQCFRCHSVDEVRDADNNLTGARVNWQSLTRSSPRSSLARYDHATHLLLMDCRSCHYTRKGAVKENYLSAFPGDGDWDFSANWSRKADPSRFQSSFSPIHKRTCASCHNPAQAGDRCTQCHQYHQSPP